MKNLIKDFLIFIKSLDFIDVLFIISILGLVILIVTLVYIIKINDDDFELADGEIDETTDDDEELDLAKISKEIDDAPSRPIVLNDYEKEQEEKAIISYDELLKTKDLREEINYIKEEELGDLKIKAVDMKEITKPIELPKIKEEYQKLVNLEDKEEETIRTNKVLISYEKEEEFLQALKKLQSLLN